MSINNPGMIEVPKQWLSDRDRTPAPSRSLPIPVDPSPISRQRGIPIRVENVPAPGEPGSAFNPVVVTREEQARRREERAAQKEQATHEGQKRREELHAQADAEEQRVAGGEPVFAPGQLDEMMGAGSSGQRRELSFDQRLGVEAAAGAAQAGITAQAPDSVVGSAVSGAVGGFVAAAGGPAGASRGSRQAAKVYERFPELDPKNRQPEESPQAAESSRDGFEF